MEKKWERKTHHVQKETLFEKELKGREGEKRKGK